MLIGLEKVVKNLPAGVENIQYSASIIHFDADMAVGVRSFYGDLVKVLQVQAIDGCYAG
jgi:hypothetical protein